MLTRWIEELARRVLAKDGILWTFKLLNWRLMHPPLPVSEFTTGQILMNC